MNVMGSYFLAVSASGASGGGMDFDALFPLVRVDAHNLYDALVPFVFVAAYGLLIYEAYRVFQGQALLPSRVLPGFPVPVDQFFAPIVLPLKSAASALKLGYRYVPVRLKSRFV